MGIWALQATVLLEGIQSKRVSVPDVLSRHPGCHVWPSIVGTLRQKDQAFPRCRLRGPFFGTYWQLATSLLKTRTNLFHRDSNVPLEQITRCHSRSVQRNLSADAGHLRLKCTSTCRLIPYPFLGYPLLSFGICKHNVGYLEKECGGGPEVLRSLWSLWGGIMAYSIERKKRTRSESVSHMAQSSSYLYSLAPKRMICIYLILPRV